MKVIDYITKAGATLSGIIIGITMVSIVYDVFMRNLFQPTVWAQPLSEMSLVYCAFLGAAYCLQKNGHVRFTVILDILKPDKRALLNSISSVLGTIISLVLLWLSSTMLADLIRSGSTPVTAFAIPDWVRYVTVPFGSLLLSIHFGIQTYDHWISWKKRKGEYNLSKKEVISLT
jgi:TRAP-type C4-dicarboxylate transport system permease small subunit